MKNSPIKDNSKRRSIVNLIGLFVLAVLYWGIYTQLDTENSKTLLIKVIFCLAAYGTLWNVPHSFSFGLADERHLPTKFFISGRILIWAGCLISVYLAYLLKGHGAWGHIAEIMPLIFGAIVGGNYCCNAILGQEFNKEDCRIGYLGVSTGGFIVTLPLIVFFSMCGPSLAAYSAIFVIGIAALLTLSALNFVENRKGLGDPPFFVFLAGAIMIVAAFISTKWLLDEASKLAYSSNLYFNEEQIFTIIKNFVPSYCAAIGAGLIVRSMENNIPAFSLEKWAKIYFDLGNGIKVNGNNVSVVRRDAASNKEQTIDIIVHSSILNKLKRGACNRRKYGERAKEWLQQYLHRTSLTPDTTAKLKLPKASELIKLKLPH